MAGKDKTDKGNTDKRKTGKDGTVARRGATSGTTSGAAGRAAARREVAKGAMAKGAAVKGAAPKRAAPKRAAPKRAAPKRAAPKRATSEGTAAKDASAKRTVASRPAKAVAGKDVPGGIAPGKGTPARNATRGATDRASSRRRSAARTAPARPSPAKAAPARSAPAKDVAGAGRGRAAAQRKATAGILAVDIGGTGLKCAVIDDKGDMLTERARVDTPHPCPPEALLDAFADMTKSFPRFDRIAIGFPGVVRAGTVLTAPNLGTDEWAGFALASEMSKRLGGQPARLINDAEMQGLGIVSGKGLELVMTLGTGVGTALFRDGALMPHMELAHHPISGDKTYDEYLGNAAYGAKGRKRWNRRLEKVIGILYTLLHYDRLYLGGGNAKHVELKLPENVIIASNDAGLTGGAMLWKTRD